MEKLKETPSLDKEEVSNKLRQVFKLAIDNGWEANPIIVMFVNKEIRTALHNKLIIDYSTHEGVSLNDIFSEDIFSYLSKEKIRGVDFWEHSIASYARVFRQTWPLHEKIEDRLDWLFREFLT